MIKWHPTKQEVEEQCAKVMAIAVTQNCERILIGQWRNVLCKLEGNDLPEVDCDITQPFGTLLLNYHLDEHGSSWDDAVTLLHRAQEIFLSPPVKQIVMESVKPLEKEALRILNKKYKTGNAIHQFLAMRIWHKYWKIRGLRKHNLSQDFLNWANNVIRPFSRPSYINATRIRIDSDNPMFPKTPDIEESDRTRIIYSSIKGYDECLFLQDSFVPLEHFYQCKTDKWVKYIVQCKECGKFFLADTLQYELCSNECKKDAQKETRDRRRENSSTAEVDKVIAAANAHWNNRLRKMRESPEWSAEEVSRYRSAMKRFQTEKSSKRKAHKNGKITFRELQSWLCQQQEEAERVFQEMKSAKE